MYNFFPNHLSFVIRKFVTERVRKRRKDASVTNVYSLFRYVTVKIFRYKNYKRERDKEMYRRKKEGIRKKEETEISRKKEREFGEKERWKEILTVTVQIYM